MHDKIKEWQKVAENFEHSRQKAEQTGNELNENYFAGCLTVLNQVIDEVKSLLPKDAEEIDFAYLKERWDLRQQEIRDEKNMGTADPVYLVMSLRECIAWAHVEGVDNTNLKGKPSEYGYIDMALDGEDRSFELTDSGMEQPEPVTRYWLDQIKSFHLTWDGAERYMEYQSHNLHDPYIYVDNIGYANYELSRILHGRKQLKAEME